ncbi:hypothetical protein HMPREF9349_04308 [Escherichia coli MS 79-10]|nr:hypothetical protein HMPREF9349_04308 [Escherichia coli MS 79-10]
MLSCKYFNPPFKWRVNFYMPKHKKLVKIKSTIGHSYILKKNISV